jgi:hypothetical protein
MVMWTSASSGPENPEIYTNHEMYNIAAHKCRATFKKIGQKSTGITARYHRLWIWG